MKKILLLLFVFLLVSVSSAFAVNEPYVISFQGKIDDPNVSLPGTYPFVFSIWKHSSDTDPSNRIWNSNAIQIPLDQDGMFNYLLGSGTALPLEQFNGQRLWVNVNFDAGSGGIDFAPRQELAAAPYAITAKNLRGGDIVFEAKTTPPAADPGAMYFNSASHRVSYFDGTKWIEMDPVYTEKSIQTKMIGEVAIMSNGDADPSATFGQIASGPEGAIITNIRIGELTSSGGDERYYKIQMKIGGKTIEFHAPGWTPLPNTNEYENPTVNFTLPIPIKVKENEAVRIGIGGMTLTGPSPVGTAYEVAINYIQLPL